MSSGTHCMQCDGAEVKAWQQVNADVWRRRKALLPLAATRQKPKLGISTRCRRLCEISLPARPEGNDRKHCVLAHRVSPTDEVFVTLSEPQVSAPLARRGPSAAQTDPRFAQASYGRMSLGLELRRAG
jgi:hypothetical protein